MDTERGPHDLDRDANESQEAYDTRINDAASAAGQSRVEYERAANDRAGRPPITHRPDSDSQESSGIL